MYNQMVLFTGIAQASAGGCSSIKHNRTIDPILLNDTSIIRHVYEDKKIRRMLCASQNQPWVQNGTLKYCLLK